MANKVLVDLVNKILAVNLGEHDIDVQVDLYSDLKEDWCLNLNGEAGYVFPFRTVGGDVISPTLKVGAYFFLRNDLGWRIRPGEEHATMNVTGNLYPEDPELPVFVPAIGAVTVSILQERSSLTQLAIPASAFRVGVAYPGFTFSMISTTTRLPQAGFAVTGERYVQGVGWTPLTNVVSDILGGDYLVDLAGADIPNIRTTLRFSAAGAVTRSISLFAAAA